VPPAPELAAVFNLLTIHGSIADCRLQIADCQHLSGNPQSAILNLKSQLAPLAKDLPSLRRTCSFS
jgi:hypothetical protein